MHIKDSIGRKIFTIINFILLTFVALACVLPFVHLLATAFSSSLSTAAGDIGLMPKEFSTEAFKYLLQKPDYFVAAGISVLRVIVGTSLGMFITVISAYPLSKESEDFKGRTIYVWFFALTMFFGGGLIPSYMVIRGLNLIDSFWVFILPGAMNVWNMVMLLNFFRNVPPELEEAAVIDGASQWQVLTRIFIPISKPSLATLTLFTAIGHWNAWFDGVMYMNTPSKYPLQTYLSTIVLDQNMSQISSMTMEQLERLQNIGDQNLQAAQIFLGALPIMLVYPFLQKYFVKGLTIGSVKG